jgi:hypothetical protein
MAPTDDKGNDVIETAEKHISRLTSIRVDEIARKVSIAKGLEIPPGMESKTFEWCGHKGTTPNWHELELASRKHRWPKVRKLQVDFFRAFMEEVTEIEIEVLRLLNLPDINEVRRAEFQDETEGSGRFRFTDRMSKELGKLFKKWREEVLGTEGAKQVEPMEAIYPYYMLSAFSIGADKTYNDVLKDLPGYLDPEQLEAARLSATMENPYLRGVFEEGGKRIKTELGRKHIARVNTELVFMASEGTNPIEVGRWLHRDIGEGKAWYWKRIARSESALAIDAAFSASAEKYGIPYERFSTAANACPICMQFSNDIWRVDEGPHPVHDTHPHCVEKHCKIYTQYGWKSIYKIQVGELVLTHTGKFKKVTKLHIHIENDQPMIEISYRNEPYTRSRKVTKLVSLKISDNHPISINGKWKEVKNIKIGDCVRIIANRCNYCRKLIPYTRWGETYGFPSTHCTMFHFANDFGEQDINTHPSDFLEIPIEKIRRYNKKRITLYNLSVEDDESYIAKGFVVHNCLCVRTVMFVPDKPVREPWTRPSPYDVPYTRDDIQALLEVA